MNFPEFPDEESWLMNHPEIDEQWENFRDCYGSELMPLLTHYRSYKYQEAKQEFKDLIIQMNDLL